MLKKKKTSSTKESIDTFIEEAVIRRELSDNFCFYCNDYDKITGAYSWAQETLRLHASDKREYLYTEEELEKGHTHDKLWNACQVCSVKVAFYSDDQYHLYIEVMTITCFAFLLPWLCLTMPL